MLLEGLFVPLTTPFYPDGRVYLRKLEHNAERYARTPAAGLAVLAASAEAEMLSDAERREVLRTAAGAAAETALLLADVTCGSVRETLRLAEDAAAAKYDVALLRVPHAPDAVQRTFVQAVADRSPLPVALVEQVGLAESLLVEAAHLPQVIGAVLVGGDTERVSRLQAATARVSREVTVTPVFAAVTGRMLEGRPVVGGGATFISTEMLSGAGTAVATVPTVPALKTRLRRVSFQVMAGRSAGALELLRAGARGLMPAFAACAPQASYEVYAAWKDDDQALADEKQERVMAAAGRIEGEMGVAGLKVACDLSGYFGGRPRLPGLPLLGEQVREVERLMRGMRH